jgi:hypothetical protein
MPYSSPLSELPLIGRLDLLDMFAYHDGPRLFTARNGVGHLFLAEWAAEDETRDIWLLVPLSFRRYRDLVTGRIEFRSAFLGSETGFVYRAEIPRIPANPQVETIPAETIPNALLPERDERVDEEEAAAIPVWERLLGSEERSVGEPAIGLRLSPPSGASGIVEAKALARFLNSLQRLCDAVFVLISHLPERSDRRPRLGLAGAYSGSLGLVITGVGIEKSDIARSTANTMREMMRLINVAMRPATKDVQVSQEIVPQLVSFLKWFQDTKVQATMTFLSDSGAPVTEAHITPDESASAVSKLLDNVAMIETSNLPELESELDVPEDLEGTFISLDINQLTYRFRSSKSGKLFSGRVRDTAIAAAQHITFGLLYHVVLDVHVPRHIKIAKADLIEIRRVLPQLTS